MTFTNRISLVLSVCSVLGMAACASVPKEAVTLSITVGEDIKQLQSGYRQTVRFSFNQMRQAALSVIDNVWTPAFVQDFIVRGRLVESVQDPDDSTELVEFWAREAIGQIDAKRKTFLDSIQVKEDALLADIDKAFDGLINANAAVTAHLNSVLKVQNVQDQVLAAAGVRDIRDTINAALVSTSEFAASATEAIVAEAKGFKPDPGPPQ